MTTREMIEVMEAYERGEAIQAKNMGSKDKWVDIKTCCWNWFEFVYRVKPKIKPKFELGDIVIRKGLEGNLDPTFFIAIRITKIDDDNYFFEKINLLDKDKRTIRTNKETIQEVDKFNIKIDDCLWYWDIYDIKKNLWIESKYRYTKLQAQQCYLGEFKHIPLYSLGFRLPKEN